MTQAALRFNVHANDPDSSFRAVKELADSGGLSKQRLEVLRLVVAYPGLTSKELAARTGYDRYRIARRLPELELLGYAIRRERESGDCQWWPSGLGIAEAGK